MRKKISISEEPPVDALSLSFLDVLSCGLAAMFVLFFVFSVLPQGRGDMSKAAQGKGLDEKISQSGVRAKGSFARPTHSPFGVKIVVETTEPNALSEEAILWERPDGVEWSAFFRVPKPDESNSDPKRDKLRKESKIFLLEGNTQNASAHFKEIKLWIAINSLANIKEMKVDVVGTVEVGYEVTLKDFTSENIGNATKKGEKTLVLTINRMKKGEWVDSDFLEGKPSADAPPDTTPPTPELTPTTLTPA